MARIQGVPLDTMNPLLRLVFWAVRKRLGQPVEPLQGYARSGAVLASQMALELCMERAQRVSEPLRKLAELRVAALVGCRFCLDIGSALVVRAGVSAEQVCDLNSYEESAAFSELEKLVLRYADATTATPVDVDDEMVRLLRAHLDEAQLLELTAAIAHENLRARMNHALGYGAQGFSSGGVCALPARAIAGVTKN